MKTGFKPNTERTEGSYSKYSSIDDKIDDFHYYTTYIKYGLGRSSMTHHKKLVVKLQEKKQLVL